MYYYIFKGLQYLSFGCIAIGQLNGRMYRKEARTWRAFIKRFSFGGILLRAWLDRTCADITRGYNCSLNWVVPVCSFASSTYNIQRRLLHAVLAKTAKAPKPCLPSLQPHTLELGFSICYLGGGGLQWLDKYKNHERQYPLTDIANKQTKNQHCRYKIHSLHSRFFKAFAQNIHQLFKNKITRKNQFVVFFLGLMP